MTGPNPADYAATATDVIRNRPGVRTAITDATVRSEQQQRDLLKGFAKKKGGSPARRTVQTAGAGGSSA